MTFRTRQPMRGVMYAGLALVGVAALSAVTQQANFTVPWEGSGINLEGFGDKISDLLPYAFFTLLPLLGALIVMGVGALAAKPGPSSMRPAKALERQPDRTGAAPLNDATEGPERTRPRITAAFVFSFFGLGMIFVGMLGGALIPLVDLGLQGTVFEEGAFVYVAYGAVLGGLGALSYWAPKWTGRLVPEVPALGLALLGVLATILASLPYYIAGFADQPAVSDVYDYDGPSALWNLAVTVGHALMALVVIAYLGLLARSARTGEQAADDPWDGQTLEWTAASPAPDANFVETPTVMSPEPALDLRAAPPGSDR